MTVEHDDILTILLGLCCEVAAGTADAMSVHRVVKKLDAQGLGPFALPTSPEGDVLGGLLARELGLPWGDPDGPREFVVRLRWHDAHGQLSDETESVVAFSPMDAARRCFMSWTERVDMPWYATAWCEGQAFELYRPLAVEATPCDEPEPEREA